jgi:F-type H+-transporting ATPase subunit b
MVSARQPRLLSAALATCFVVGSLWFAGSAFIPVARSSTNTAAVAGTAALAASVATPAFAEEAGGFLNFGRIPLGGGFAINLDIPETGIVNIVILIAGLLYLLAPLLSESMESRSKEIQQDIDDAIAKYEEASSRLAEAQKAKSQADEVIAEINASIEKDQADFKKTIEAQTQLKLSKQAELADKTIEDLKAGAQKKVDSYIQAEAVSRGLKELMSISDDQKTKFMESAIASL